MKRILLSLLIVTFLIIAYASKPDDKTCIIAAVKEVWGDKTPDVNKFPVYFEQFMDVTSQAIIINDWVFVKQIKYKTNDGAILVGYGAFKHFIPVRNGLF